MGRFEFVNPEFFWLFLLLPLLLLWQIITWRKKQAAVHISSLEGFKSGEGNWLSKLQPILVILRILPLTAIIIAIARPRIVDPTTSTRSIQGIDIIIVIDDYADQLARDLRPNLLDL